MSKRTRNIFEFEEDGARRREKLTAFSVMQTWIRPIFAEFFGTMMLVFIGSLSKFVGGSDPSSSLLVSALAEGLIVACIIAGVGQPSGGHLNPAITLAVLCSSSGGINLALSFFFMISQLAGASFGALLILAVLTPEQYDSINGGVIVPGMDILIEKAIASEWILTTILVSTALQVAVERKASVLAPFVIGLTVVSCILAGATTSGACMNPARSFGPALVSGNWTSHWLYWVGPPAGAVTSALIYRFLLASPDKRLILKESPSDDY